MAGFDMKSDKKVWQSHCGRCGKIVETNSDTPLQVLCEECEKAGSDPCLVVDVVLDIDE